MSAPVQDLNEELVVVHDVIEIPVSTRRRVLTAVGFLVTGIVVIVGWGLGANSGNAAFALSLPSDKYRLSNLEFPGGVVAMALGGLIVVIGGGQLVRAYTRAQMRWAITLTVLFFVLAFFCWAGTGNPDNPISLTGLVSNSLLAAIPLVLGALAGIVCERSGVINIAIEGQLLVGAFAGALIASSSKSLGIGIVAAMIAGGIIGLLLAWFAIRYLVNQIVLGVVLNLFALGLTNLGYHSIMQTDPDSYNAGMTLPSLKIPLLGDIPVLGRAFFDVNVIAYLTYALAVAVQVVLFRTRWGLRTRAVGEHPKAADTVGIKVIRMRYINVVIGGLIAGLGGAILTVGGSGAFNQNISSGKGFIALAAVIFGRWSPKGAIAAALLFGFTDQLQTTLTIVQTPVTIPSAFLAMAPYVVTIIAVAGFIGHVLAPAADGEPYQKG